MEISRWRQWGGAFQVQKHVFGGPLETAGLVAQPRGGSAREEVGQVGIIH